MTAIYAVVKLIRAPYTDNQPQENSMIDRCGRYVDERGIVSKAIGEVKSIPPVGWLYFVFIVLVIVSGLLTGWPDLTIGR